MKVLDLQFRNFGCTGPNEEDIKQLPRTFSLLLNLSFAPAHIPTGCVQRQRGLSHGLKTVHWTVFGAPFRVPSPIPKKRRPGGAALRTFSLLLNLGFAPAHIPTGCVQRQRGLSHGLKTVHRTVFGAPFRVPSPIPKKRRPGGAALFWCERGDSNPHGVTTRTSNVLVYHSNTLAVARVL